MISITPSERSSRLLTTRLLLKKKDKEREREREREWVRGKWGWGFHVRAFMLQPCRSVSHWHCLCVYFSAGKGRAAAATRRQRSPPQFHLYASLMRQDTVRLNFCHHFKAKRRLFFCRQTERERWAIDGETFQNKCSPPEEVNFISEHLHTQV